MNRRVFWTVPDCTKFRTVFEDAETILGVDEKNQHRLFRKDSKKIVFSDREALKAYVSSFLEKEFAAHEEPAYV